MAKLRDILRILATPCREATQLISRAQDETLDWPLRAAIRVHTTYCSKCRRFRHQLQVMRDALGGLADEGHDGGTAELSREARERIGKTLHSAGETGQ